VPIVFEAHIEQIIDNGDVGYGETGTWLDVDSPSDAYQSDARYSTESGTNTATFTFTVPATRAMYIFEWHPTEAGSSTATPISVSGTHTGSTTVDQSINGGWWTGLLAFESPASGGTLTVTITNDTTPANYLADAVAIIYVDEADVITAKVGSLALQAPSPSIIRGTPTTISCGVADLAIQLVTAMVVKFEANDIDCGTADLVMSGVMVTNPLSNTATSNPMIGLPISAVFAEIPPIRKRKRRKALTK